MARKIKLCKESGCSNQQTTLGYCRLHYLKNWKKIRADSRRKAAKHLNKYINSIMRADPDAAARNLKKNLKNERTFEKSVDDLFYSDSAREVMSDLGYKDDLDGMIDSIKIDEDF